MDTNIITWIFMGIFVLFIIFKFKKMLPFKQDARSVNYYHTEQHPVKEKVIHKVHTIKDKPVKKEVIDENYDEDDYKDTTNHDDIWSNIAEDNARIANDMFGFDDTKSSKKRSKKNDDGFDGYW